MPDNFDPNYLLQSLLARGQITQQEKDRAALMTRFREQLQLEQDKADATKKEIDARAKLYDIQGQQAQFGLGQAGELAHVQRKVAEGGEGPAGEYFRNLLLSRDPQSMLGVAGAAPGGPGAGATARMGMGTQLNPAQQMQGLLGYRGQNIEQQLGQGQLQNQWALGAWQNRIQERQTTQQADQYMFGALLETSQRFGLGPTIMGYAQAGATRPQDIFAAIDADPRIPQDAKDALPGEFLDRMIQEQQFGVTAWLEMQKIMAERAKAQGMTLSAQWQAQNKKVENLGKILTDLAAKSTEAKDKQNKQIMRVLAELVHVTGQYYANVTGPSGAGYSPTQYAVPPWGDPGMWGTLRPGDPFQETQGRLNPMTLDQLLTSDLTPEQQTAEMMKRSFAFDQPAPPVQDEEGETPQPVLPPTPPERAGVGSTAGSLLKLAGMAQQDPEIAALYNALRSEAFLLGDPGASQAKIEQYLRIASMPKGEQRTRLINVLTATGR